MGDFGVRLLERNGQPVLTRLSFDVVRYSWGEGGPVAAQVDIGDMAGAEQALRLLGCKMFITAPDSAPVWWGLVTEVTATDDGMEYGVSLADMANRIQVLYTIETEGNSTPAQTAWAEDARSISLYGRKELRYSMGAATPDEALRVQAQLLAQKSMPQLIAKPGQGADGATLHCTGFWSTLDWRYLAQDSGRIVHSGENEVEQLLGWGFQNSQLVGLNSRDRRIHQLGAQMTALSEGDRIRVSGSTSNNGDFTVAKAASIDKQVIYTSGSISFDPTDDMHDGNEWLDQFTAGEMLYIENSTNNNGFWFLKSVAPDHATLHPATVVAEPGGTATITQGNSVQVSETLTLEKPVPGSKFVTVQAHGVKLAQSFAVSGTDSPWTPGEVVISLRRVGSPSDAVKIELCADNGSGGAGTVLDSATVAGSLLPAKSLATVTFSLARTATLTPGATYWLVVSRTGAIDPVNFYMVGIDQDASYIGGGLYLFNGATWAAKVADLQFQVWGHAATSAQLADLVAAVAGDGYVTGASIRAASGVYGRRYRDGQQSALVEAQKLLASGTINNDRLVATVDANGVLIVEAVNTLDTLRWKDGRIVTRFGKPLPTGHLPVGQWLQIDAPRMAGMLTSDLQMVTRAEYDVASDTMTPEFGQSAWDAGSIQQG